MKVRRRYLVALGAVVAPVLFASLAYACTSLATLGLNPQQGEAGRAVTVTGRGFVPHGTEARSGQPVDIRFDSQRNPVLATVTPATDGSFSVQITVPEVAAGNHVVIASQARNDGSVASGTPARQAFTVTAPARAPSQAPTAVPQQQQAAPAPVARPAAQALPGAPAVALPAPPVVGQGAPASGQPTPAGFATGSQGGPPTATGAAPGTAMAPAAPAPAPFGAPAAAPVGRRSMTTPAAGPSAWIAVLLVAAGLMLTVGGTAMVIAGRRGQSALALIRRPRS